MPLMYRVNLMNTAVPSPQANGKGPGNQYAVIHDIFTKPGHQGCIPGRTACARGLPTGFILFRNHSSPFHSLITVLWS